MPTLTGRIRKRLLMPDLSEATFEKRGFTARDPQAQEGLEHSGRQFLVGFGYAMTSRDMAELSAMLDTIDRAFRGFAYEGASMALAITDAMTPWRRRRVRAFVDGPATAHIYMAHVGIGWAMARLPKRLWPAIVLPDPLLRWLALDGYGFHQAYFATQTHVAERRPPTIVPPWPDPSGYAARAVDQGIGRALWFACGADVERLATVIGTFSSARWSDLWSGAGLAATYAGGVGADDLENLVKLAGEHRGDLAQGSAFAGKARLLSGLVLAHTSEAVGVICDRSVEEAARLTDTALDELPPDGALPAFELWRQRIRADLTHD